MRTVVAEEWSRISFSHSGVSRSELEAIDDRARSVGIADLLRWDRSGATPQNWLGIVRAGSVQLQVVPKGWGQLGQNDRVQVQSLLVALLARASGVPLTLSGLGFVRPEPTLLDLLYRLFLNACNLALRRQAVRTYRRAVETGVQMRGSLVFPEQSMIRLVNPGLFVTTRTELTWDNSFNRVLAAACDRVIRSRREDLRASAQVLAVAVRAAAVPIRLQFDRQAARRMRLRPEHARCLQLAELILDSAGGAGLFAGDPEVGAELVSTWRLWEAGIASIACSRPGLAATAQPSGHYALQRVVGGGQRYVLELRPDILVAEPERAVLDSKWKIIDATAPVLDTGDLHQALDYARHFHLARIVLMYPAFVTKDATPTVASWETTTEPTVVVAACQLPMLSGMAALEDAVGAAIDRALGRANVPGR